MQERPSDSLPLTLLKNEIDEVGRSLAHLIQPGSSLGRRRRARIRAVLREGFLAAQEEDGTLDELTATLGRLRLIQREFAEDGDTPLVRRLARHEDIGGGVSPWLLARGTFEPAGEREADALAADVEARVERVLSTLKTNIDEEGQVGEVRPLRQKDEAKELVTKKV